jgi:hypothetical protein
MLLCYENIISFKFYFQDNFLRPHLSFFDPFTATSRPLTATNLPRPKKIFYGYISGKWPSPRPSGNPDGIMFQLLADCGNWRTATNFFELQQEIYSCYGRICGKSVSTVS